MSNNNDQNAACQSTPREELERRIMDPNIPKNEQEHWAANEIHRLRNLLNSGCPPASSPSEPSATDAVKAAAHDPFVAFAISLVKRHAGCDDSGATAKYHKRNAASSALNAQGR